MELLEYTFETLRKDGEFIVYRGHHRRPANGSPPSILVMTPVSERPALGSLRRMEHEYSLRAELDPGWAVRPLALAPHKGRTMLVLTDPGGEPLDRMLGRPMELTQFLRPAVGVSAALAQTVCGLPAAAHMGRPPHCSLVFFSLSRSTSFRDTDMIG